MLDTLVFSLRQHAKYIASAYDNSILFILVKYLVPGYGSSVRDLWRTLLPFAFKKIQGRLFVLELCSARLRLKVLDCGLGREVAAGRPGLAATIQLGNGGRAAHCRRVPAYESLHPAGEPGR